MTHLWQYRALRPCATFAFQEFAQCFPVPRPTGRFALSSLLKWGPEAEAVVVIVIAPRNSSTAVVFFGFDHLRIFFYSICSSGWSSLMFYLFRRVTTLNFDIKSILNPIDAGETITTV